MILSPYKLTLHIRTRYRDGATAWLQAISEVCRVFRSGSITKRLNQAFDNFKSWCRENHKGTSLTEFSLKAFKIKTPLYSIRSDRVMSNALFSDVGMRFLKYRVLPRNQQIPMRLTQYPTGCGKGHDTAVLGAWLLHEVSSVDAAAATASSLIWPYPQSPKLNANSDRPHALSLKP